MIRYLKQEEKTKSRKLWNQAFPEDSESFLDFYYTEKVRKNKILAAEEDGAGVVAMLHRNPYDVVVKDRIWKVDYIAGVATHRDYGHQGYMSRLLNRCFADLYMERMGFCFLVPASPAIYHPFEFTYICDLPDLRLNERADKKLKGRSCMEHYGECREAAKFAGKHLEKRYEVYALRDEEYYSSLCREVRSDKGDLILLYSGDERQRLGGVWAYYGEMGQTQRELLCLPEYQMESSPNKPAVMGRIIHLEQFVSVISLKEECEVSEMELFIEVKDGFIRQNDGVFRWKLCKNGSSLTRVDENRIKPHLSMSISTLTAWLFGYEIPYVPEDRRSMVNQVRPLKGVFFDEIT